MCIRGLNKPSLLLLQAFVLLLVLVLVIVIEGYSSTSRSRSTRGRQPGPSPSATTWPHYRGTAQQLGVASGKLARRLKVNWKFRTGGPVTSSPVVAGGQVFIGSADGFVYALRLDNGRKIWAFKTGDAVEAPPSVVGGAVVVGSSDGVLYSLDAATGKPRWKYRTEDKILGAANWAPAPGGKGTWLLVGSYDNR